jgi:hypothetical protein
VQLGPFGVSGWNDIVAVWTEPLEGGTTFGPTSLRIFRQDPTNPDLLLSLATLSPSQPSQVSFSVNEQWVVLYAIGSGGAGWAELMKTAGPYASPTTVSLSAPVQVATAWNDRLVTASATALEVYDFTNPASPSRVGSFTMSATATAMAGVGAGVYVFTDAGYGYVDLGGGTYTEVSSPDLARAQRASAHGTKIYIAGPSKYVGHYRIAKLDASSPPALSIELAADQIADSDSWTQDIADASLDAQSGNFSLFQSSQSQTMGIQGAILLYESQATGFLFRGSGVLNQGACTVSCGPEERWMPRIHVHNRRAYVIPAQHWQASLYTYRLP